MGNTKALRATMTAVLVALVASVFVAAPRPSEAAQVDPPQPNILFIMTDDQDRALMDYMPLTQSLLVDEGVTFTNGLVDLPLCCPARATTMLGQGARKHGIYTNRAPLGGYSPFLPLEDETVAVWMDRAGYDTAFFGKYVNGYPTSGLREELHIPVGWDRWFGLWEDEQDPYNYEVNDDGVIRSGLGYNTDVMSAAAADFITESDDDPFFMMILDTAPHVPHVPAPRHENLYPGLTAPRNPNYDEADISDKTYYGAEPPLSNSVMTNYDEEYRLRVLEMQAVDEMVAELVASLDAAGKLDNTYIVFTSDNGYLLGEHRLRGKVFPYEEAINVPLVVRGPGIAPGTTNDELVGNIDFAPTFTAMAGGEVTIDVDGANFMGLVSDRYPVPDWREIFRVNAAFFDAARSKDDILIHFATGGREYYDLVADPYQLDNTYDSMDATRKAELESAIAAFVADNEKPVVDAGPDQTVTSLGTTLSGVVTDDGLPYATDLLTLPPTFEQLTHRWSQISGPPGVEFSDPSSLTSAVTFPSVGVYQLGLTGDDSTGAVVDVLTVFVRPPTVRAGFVASRASLVGPDQAARDLMIDAGIEVTPIDDDDDLSALDLSLFDVLIVSSSVAPTNVGDVFKDAPLPVLTWENYLFGDLGLATEKVTAATETRITIQDAGHPIAAGLSGAPTVYSQPTGLSYGSVPETAQAIASVVNDEDKTVLAAYAAGDTLADGTAAAGPRVMFFADYRGPQYFSSLGEVLFTASLNWIASQQGEPTAPLNQQPVVQAGPETTLTLPTNSLDLNGSVTDDGLPGGELTIAWSQVSGPAGVSFADASVAGTTATFPGAGTYVVRLSGSDGELTAVGDRTVTVVAANNDAPVVLAGSDVSQSLPNLQVALVGSVTDDGEPNGSVTSTWSQLDGPAGVSFADASSPVTTATMPGTGMFTLQLAATDGELTTTDVLTVTVSESNGNRTAALIAGSTSPPAGDRDIHDLLVGAGIDVTIVDDDSDLTSLDLSQFELLVIASSVVPSKVGDVFTSAPLPILTWENYLYTDLAMATERLSPTTETQITIADPSHPIASGASGSVTVYGTANKLAWGAPSPDAHVIAHFPGNPDRPVIFAYAAGDTLIDGSTAAAARIGIFPNYNGARSLATAGEELIAAAIEFAIGAEPPPPDPNRAPTVDAGAAVVIDLPSTSVALAGSVTDDGLPAGAALTTEWTQIGGPAGVSFADASDPATTATMPGAGTYTLQLSATDTEFTVTDDMTVTVQPVDDGEPQALFVSRTTDLPLSDRAIRDLLIEAGYEIQVADDDSDLELLDTAAFDVIALSSSVSSSKVGDVFKDTATPLVTWEGSLFLDMGLATEESTTDSLTTLEIVDPTHPIAAGESNEVSVYTRSNSLDWGVPSGDAQVIATVPGQPEQPVIISYRAGDTLIDGTIAAGHRVALFPDSKGARQMSATGRAIVAAAFAYATNDAPMPTNTAPEVGAGPEVTIALPDTTVALRGEISDDGLPAGEALQVVWSQLAGPDGVTFGDPTDPETIATMPGAGSYTLQLSASDGEFTTTAVVDITVDGANETKEIVMVAGNSTPPSGDRQIRDLLVTAGHNLTIIDDDSDLAGLDTTQLDLIVIASSVVPSKVGDTFKNTSVPLLTWENYLFEDLGLASENITGSTETSLVIADPAHPAAGGATGVVTVYSSPNRLVWGTPSADAEVIAHVDGDTDKAVIIAYTAGDTLIDGTIAAAARMVIFPDYNGARALSSNGEALVLAAITALL